MSAIILDTVRRRDERHHGLSQVRRVGETLLVVLDADRFSTSFHWSTFGLPVRLSQEGLPICTFPLLSLRLGSERRGEEDEDESHH